MLHDLNVPESTWEQIVMMAADEGTKDAEILKLLQTAPVSPQEAALRLANSLPLHNSSDRYQFMPSRARLFHVAWNDGEGECSNEAGMYLATTICHMRGRSGLEQAIQILDRILQTGDARAYSSKAKAYAIIFGQSWDKEERQMLASEYERALLIGVEQRDAWSSAALGDAYWHGKIVEKDRRFAKVFWLQAAEWGDPKLGALLHNAMDALSPRPLTAPWAKNPEADAEACLQYTLATAASPPDSRCRLGLYYYLRPGMSREEHVQIWTVEPDDSTAAENFFDAVRQNCVPARSLFAEMLIWDRASVSEDTQELIVPSRRISGDGDEIVEAVEPNEKNSEESGTNEPSTTEPIPPVAPVPPNASSPTPNETGSSRRRQQLLLAQGLLQTLLSHPTEFYRTVPGRLSLCARLMTELDAGGTGLPTAGDVHFVNPPRARRGSGKSSPPSEQRRQRRLERSL